MHGEIMGRDLIISPLSRYNSKVLNRARAGKRKTNDHEYSKRRRKNKPIEVPAAQQMIATSVVRNVEDRSCSTFLWPRFTEVY